MGRGDKLLGKFENMEEIAYLVAILILPTPTDFQSLTLPVLKVGSALFNLASHPED